MTSLEFMSDELSRRDPEWVIEDQFLQDMRSELSELLSEVESSDLPEQFRSQLLKELCTLIDAINDYALFGIELLKEAANLSTGFVFNSFSMFAEERNNPVVQHFLETVSKLRKTLGSESFHETLGRAANIAQLGEAGMKALAKLEDVIKSTMG